MNHPLEIVCIALLQGLTEFLPISSSAHLILVPYVTGWADQGIAMDVAVHIGTLLAVIGYFRKEIKYLCLGFLRQNLPTTNKPTKTNYGKLANLIILATIPVVIFGLMLHDFIALYLRSPIVIAVTTIVFGLILWGVDRINKNNLKLTKLKSWQALSIGLAQAIALIPGTSRSGITLTAGLALGLNRKAAAKFSFLLAIPTILMAGGYEGLKLVTSTHAIAWGQFGLGIIIAAVSAYFCIKLFLSVIDKIGVLPFVVYRLILGAVLLIYFV